MRIQSILLTLSVGAASAALIGCTPENPTPTEATVRLTVIAGSHYGGSPFSQTLTQEVTSVPVWAGDPDGIGTALITVNRGKGEVCWEESVSGITLPATASHIHHEQAGIRGPIVITLSPPGAAGTSVGCRSGVDGDLLQDILENPASYYVNVHTRDFPSGAIRSQLMR
jgi:hypothetical protein